VRVLVTGAGGFVGRALLDHLAAAGHIAVAATRGAPLPNVETRIVGGLGPRTDWSAALEGIEAVVHLAARVHRMRETAADPLAAYRETNAAGTRCLAEAAAGAGARRLVFLSTIKVHGETTPPERPFRDDDPALPQDPYALSKWEAEQGLAAVAAATGLEAVVLRPPLVYGPGVRANFGALLRLCDSALPLPLGAVDNRRSLIFLGNLTDAICRALEHPAAAGESFLVADREALSTSALVRRLRAALGRPARLPPVPPGWLRLAGRIAGRDAVVARLLGSLVADTSGIEHTLGWQPPVAADQGLVATARAYREAHRAADSG
jgi:nucleoside-diphosphate-sugar epimerase